MRIFKFQAMLTIKDALAAVQRNGDALQYVLNFDLAVEVGAKIGVCVER